MNMSVSMLQNAMAFLFVLNIENVDISSVSYYSFLLELQSFCFFSIEDELNFSSQPQPQSQVPGNRTIQKYVKVFVNEQLS